MPTLFQANKRVSSRRQIDIRGVSDGVLELGSKQYRMVLKVSPVNFDLKGEAEQDAINDTYQGFLNSLPCPVQIISRNRRMDMDLYLGRYEQMVRDETDESKRGQIEQYITYVRSLLSTNRITSRHFYIVVTTGFQAIDEARTQLALNAGIITTGLARLGIQTRRLGDLETLNLFYEFYNPDKAKHQPLPLNVAQYTNGSV